MSKIRSRVRRRPRSLESRGAHAHATKLKPERGSVERGQVFDDLSTPVHTRVVELLLKLSSGLRRFAWDRAAAMGLTPTQAEILRLVQRAPQGLRMGEVAAALGVSAPTASDSVAALENKGLLTRQTDAGDRRVSRLAITREGSHVAAALDDWFDSVAAAVATLPAESEVDLLTMLMQVLTTLQKTEGMPTAKMCVSCRYFAPYVSDDPRLPHRCELVDAPFGDRHLRVDCPEHSPAPAEHGAERWSAAQKRRLALASASAGPKPAGGLALPEPRRAPRRQPRESR